jgi:FlaA1/EpsC-like NDP-sugar epimerase
MVSIYTHTLSEIYNTETTHNMLITGGTGSLGSHLVPHFLKKGYDVTVLSRDEDKQSKMMKTYPNVKFILGDIRDYDTCIKATKNMDVVIHTAALKRVEFGEMYPNEFIKTNVNGTVNITHACVKNNVPKMVFISTDKAVRPINLYGMCKAVAERFVVSRGYNAVRYGNVNNSRGSVLPFWKELKKKNLPIPLTNPKMTRFLIDFNEATRMIELAMEEMDGCVYIPKLYAANIKDMAECFGKVQIIGERQGEKLHEELISYDEFRGRVEERKECYVVHQTRIAKDMKKEYNSNSVKKLRGEALRKAIEKYLKS